MSDRSSEEMEGRTVVPSQSAGRDQLVPRSKGQWRGKNRRGQNYGRLANQERYRQQRDLSERRDGCNQPQRRGTMPDRRPPSRGFFPTSGESRKGSRSDALQDVSVTSCGSKKYGTSLNHLLNFKYAPREKPVIYHSRSSSRKYTPFNKEQFIQANFQFVVCDSGDYTVHAMDPDVLVEWDMIEQVRIFSHEVPSCPICLYPPVAAKITRCGHIYCWSCILHYLSLTDKSWQKCPICYEAVHKKDLKSVVALESHPYSAGDTIRMRLMKRAKNSVLVIPKARWDDKDCSRAFGIDDEKDTHYAKLLLASREEVLRQIINPEETALSTQLMEARNEQSEEVCYIEVALDAIKARKQSLSESKYVEEEVRSLMESVTCDESHDQKNGQEVTSWKVLSPDAIEGVGDYEAAFSDEEGGEGEDPASEDFAFACESSASVSEDTAEVVEEEDSLHSNQRTSESSTGDSGSESASRPLSPPTSTQYYYFYQADDGQNVFLSSLNARCLIKEYGSLENSPEFITGQILEMDALSQSEALRKKYRYLSHLPLTCEFVICELDIKPPFLSWETLSFFKEELQRRKHQRQKKLRMEKRREQKCGTAGNPSYSFDRSASKSVVPEAPYLQLASDSEFPVQAGQLALSPRSNSSPSPFMQLAASIANQDEGCVTVSEAEGANAQENLGPSPPSFAQALRSTKAVETTKLVEKPKPTVITRIPAWAEDDNEDYIPVPTFQSAFTEALGAAASTGQGAPEEQSSGKKQKKNKKKLLFTTGSFMKYS